MKTLLCCTLAAAALALAACSAPTAKPETVMSTVAPGMTQNDVIKRVGPPDRFYGESGNECFQYALGKYGDVPFAIYFKRQTVIATARASCDPAQVRALAGPAVAWHSTDYSVTRR